MNNETREREREIRGMTRRRRTTSRDDSDRLTTKCCLVRDEPKRQHAKTNQVKHTTTTQTIRQTDRQTGKQSIETETTLRKSKRDIEKGIIL